MRRQHFGSGVVSGSVLPVKDDKMNLHYKWSLGLNAYEGGSPQ